MMIDICEDVFFNTCIGIIIILLKNAFHYVLKKKEEKKMTTKKSFGTVPIMLKLNAVRSGLILKKTRLTLFLMVQEYLRIIVR